ncbi:hypothetical protein [Sphingomonas sp. SRS2]|uniref:hypothetical protein n=1 Tax=Sphingomonas sp. SRS2 TaxID=133190 RepID=UPI001364D497|nr:hypothetical protein [Sphingomonas sp. SRS2]
MVDRQNIIAVGLLTRADLDLLGRGFRAAIPVQDVHGFEALLDAIDDAERHALGKRG